MSALPPIATSIAFFGMSALGPNADIGGQSSIASARQCPYGRRFDGADTSLISRTRPSRGPRSWIEDISSRGDHEFATETWPCVADDWPYSTHGDRRDCCGLVHCSAHNRRERNRSGSTHWPQYRNSIQNASRVLH